jgi:hypothetical protein
MYTRFSTCKLGTRAVDCNDVGQFGQSCETVPRVPLADLLSTSHHIITGVFFMRIARTVVTLALLSIAASPVFAAPGKKPAAPKNTVAYYKTIDKSLNPVTLTDDEKTKLDALKKDYEQKFVDAYAKQNVRTPEQKKAAAEARDAAKAAGKTRQEITKADNDAVKLTDEQKAQRKDANKALRALQTEFKGKVMDLLTDAQKKELDAAKPKKASKAAKPAA